MKNLCAFIFSLVVMQFAYGQYCGVSDSLQCNPDGMPVNPGLYPPADSFPAFYNNFLTSATIRFRNFDTILFGDEVLPVYSLTWDTIENLPPGLCWSTNKANNTYATGETGCIHISGLACGPTGQYKAYTLVTVNIGIPVETDGDPGGLGYFFRLTNYGDTLVPVDTLQTDSMPFIPYGGICQSLTPPLVSLGTDQTVCAGSIVTFNPVVSGGQPPYTYLWQSTGSSIICPACPDASVTVNENSEFVLKVTDASGGFAYDTIVYNVSGTPYNFQVTSTQPDVFCGGGTVTLTASHNDSVSYQWYQNNTALTGETSYMLTVTNAGGAYELVYTESNGCNATSNVVNIKFYDTTAVSIVAEGSDTICLGGSVTLQAVASGENLVYIWLSGDSIDYDSTSAVIANTAGYYQVMVINQQGCMDTSAGVLIVASPNPPTALTYTQFHADTVCDNGTAITLAGGLPAGGYYSGAGVSNGVFTPVVAGTGLNYIYYTYTDSTGCSTQVQDTVDVQICANVSPVNKAEVISLYPNPATNMLMAEGDILKQGDVQLSLFDVNGRRLYVQYQHYAGDKIGVNIDNLAPGCYWLRFYSPAGSAGKSFIKAE